MNIRQISSRAIRNEKKRGASFKDLCEKYQCTEEALEDVIRRFFYGGASEMIAELREVDKKRERRENHRSANSHPKDSVIPPPRGPFSGLCSPRSGIFNFPSQPIPPHRAELA